MKRLTEEQILQIINKYQSGETPLNIAKEFGIFNNSVTRILRKRGVVRNQLERVDKTTIDYIIERYSNGESSEIIAKNLNIHGSTVCRILKKNNIDIRSGEDNNRKYEINQDYFENVDTEEKANKTR